MSEHDHDATPPPGAAPPPGAPPPGAPHHEPYPQPHPQPHPQAYPQPYPTAPGSPPGPARLAAHKPGAVPLRPLRLGDMYDAAFRILRYNPKATVGAAVAVSTVAWALPVLLTVLLALTVGASFDLAAEDGGLSDAEASEFAAVLGQLGALVLGSFLQQIGLLFVTAVVVHVVATAAVGRKIGLGEAWAATRGRRWRLVGMSLLLSLVSVLVLTVAVLLGVAAWAATGDVLVTVLAGVLLGVLTLVVMVLFYVRVAYVAVPVLMLEGPGILAALRRSAELTRSHFWRTFGIGLLTALVAGVAGQVLAFPVSLVGQLGAVAVDPAYQLVLLTIVQAIAGVLAAAFTAPFTTAVTSLQYLDLRMRKEAFDVELMERAGLTTR